MSSDCDQLSKSVNSALRIGIKAPVLCIGSVVYAMGLDMGLSWIVLAVVLGVTALITAYLAESGRRFRRVREAMDRVNTTVEEFLRGIRLIRALGAGGVAKIAAFRRPTESWRRPGIQLQLLSAWFAPLVTLTVNLGIAAVLWAAGRGGAEAGTVSALVTYMTQMLTSLMTLVDVFKLLIRARTSVRRVEEVLALPEEGTLEGPEEAGVRGAGAGAAPCDLRLPRGKRRARPAGHLLHTAAGGAAGGGGSHRRGQDHPGLAVRPAL